MAETRVNFDIIVADGFVLTELAGVVDVLRLCNRVSPTVVFEWTYRSVKGVTAQSSAGASVETQPILQRPEVNYVFVLGNADPEHPDLSLGPVMQRYTSRQTRVVLLAEAASRYIAERPEDTNQHTTHWENRAVLLERLDVFDSKASLVADGGSVTTCAGMGATVDLTLSIAAQHVSAATLMTVADILLHERIRHFNTLQPFAGRATLATGDHDVDTCIGLMQDNIEEPLPIALIAKKTGVSKRSLERKFHRFMRTTPNGYYRELRLNKANNLLLNTDMAIGEIGLACGFPSGFTAVYKTMFGMTPNAARQKGRAKPIKSVTHDAFNQDGAISS